MGSKEFMTLGSTLVVLGIIFGTEGWLIGYAFIGAGALLSIISAATYSGKAKEASRTGGV